MICLMSESLQFVDIFGDLLVGQQLLNELLDEFFKRTLLTKLLRLVPAKLVAVAYLIALTLVLMVQDVEFFE